MGLVRGLSVLVWEFSVLFWDFPDLVGVISDLFVDFSEKRENRLLFALLRLGFCIALSIVTTSGPSSDLSAVRGSVGGSYDVRRMSCVGIATVCRLRARASNC